MSSECVSKKWWLSEGWKKTRKRPEDNLNVEFDDKVLPVVKSGGGVTNEENSDKLLWEFSKRGSKRKGRKKKKMRWDQWGYTIALRGACRNQGTDIDDSGSTNKRQNPVDIGFSRSKCPCGGPQRWS